MMEDPLDRNLYELPAPLTGPLPDKDEKVFIYETGMRIGIATVIGIRDDAILVDIEFTDMPRLGHLYYVTIANAAGLGGGQ